MPTTTAFQCFNAAFAEDSITAMTASSNSFVSFIDAFDHDKIRTMPPESYDHTSFIGSMENGGESMEKVTSAVKGVLTAVANAIGSDCPLELTPKTIKKALPRLSTDHGGERPLYDTVLNVRSILSYTGTDKRLLNWNAAVMAALLDIQGAKNFFGNRAKRNKKAARRFAKGQGEMKKQATQFALKPLALKGGTGEDDERGTVPNTKKKRSRSESQTEAPAKVTAQTKRHKRKAREESTVMVHVPTLDAAQPRNDTQKFERLWDILSDSIYKHGKALKDTTKQSYKKTLERVLCATDKHANYNVPFDKNLPECIQVRDWTYYRDKPTFPGTRQVIAVMTSIKKAMRDNAGLSARVRAVVE